VKKPDEEAKREPSPELAKISALVTRPPKQKSASKKTEEGILDGSPALPTDSFSANLTSVPLASAPRAKKSNFQNLSQSELISPPHFDLPSKLPNLVPPQQPPYYFVSMGFNNHIYIHKFIQLFKFALKLKIARSYNIL